MLGATPLTYYKLLDFYNNGIELQTGSATSVAVDAVGDVFFEISKFVDGNSSFAVYELPQGSAGGSSSLKLLGTLLYNTGGSLLLDSAGDLIGDASKIDLLNKGGGALFELAKSATGYSASTLTSFSTTASPLATPEPGLVMDANGDLFGETATSPTGTGGAIYELVKAANGYAASTTVLASFLANTPAGHLVMDASGDLFGTLSHGSNPAGGSIFELVKTASGYAASVISLVDLPDGSGLSPKIVLDARGDIFGITSAGGANGAGSVFELVKTATGYATSVQTLYSFTSADGGPPADLVIDKSGNLFGISAVVSNSGNSGSVWELGNGAGGYATALTILHSFKSSDGMAPDSLVLGADGNLYGTTNNLGTQTEGSLFEIAGAFDGSVASALTAWRAGAVSAPIAISDSAANISAALDTLQVITAAGDASSIALTDSGFVSLAATPAQMSADAQALDKIGGNFNLVVSMPSDSSATLTGRPGHGDVAVFSGTASSYSLAAAGDGTHFTVRSGAISDTMSGITALQFSDTTLFVASQAPAVPGGVSSAQIASLYAAAFARTPDVPGLAYYENLAANRTDGIVSYAQRFLSSPEYTSSHSYAETTNGDAQFLLDTYKNLLGRAPEAGAVTWYQANVIAPILGGAAPGTAAHTSAELAAHATVLADFSQSAEFLGNVQVTSANPASNSHWLLLI